MKNDVFDDFTSPAEYSANQQGRITESQRDLLRLTASVTWVMMLVSLLMLGGISGFVVLKWRQTSGAIPSGVWAGLGVLFGLPVLYCVFQLARNWNMTRDIRSGHIASVEGTVRWNGRRYVLSTAVAGLQSVHGPIEILPGRYRFYFLPHARRLLSAQPIETLQDRIGKHRAALRRAMGFTAADVKRCEQGLAPDTMLRHAFRRRLLAALAGLLAVVGGAWLAGQGLAGGTAKITLLVSAALVTAAGMLPAVAVWHANSRAHPSPAVSRMQGAIRKTFTPRTRSTDCKIVCGNRTFRVSARTYNALLDARDYALYYATATGTLIAADPLEQG